MVCAAYGADAGEHDVRRQRALVVCLAVFDLRADACSGA
jgi:hypothetical protein